MGCMPTFTKVATGSATKGALCERVLDNCARNAVLAQQGLSCFQDEVKRYVATIAALTKERDELKKQLAALQGQYNFCKGVLTVEQGKAQEAIMGAASETTGASLKLGAVAVAALVAGFFAGRKTKS